MGVAQSDTADKLDEAVPLSVLSDVKHGDFGVRMPLEWTGVAGKIADTLNDVIAANQTLGSEMTRVSRVVGKEGKLSQRAAFTGSNPAWADSIDAVNSLIEDLVRPTREMQRVIGAVADGDLSKKISADVKGEFLELKNTVNAMVDQLDRVASEVTRVAREVGVEGKLGGQAQSAEVAGVWKDLGRLASRLAEQNLEVERKNQEVELAKQLAEERAEQLAISSKYKSEFFSNMSHELRTPLNSLLILARELADNPDVNLTEAQVQYAGVIHSSGTDLLRLLDDILDLAKVESGTVSLQISALPLAELQGALQLDFGHVADQKGLAYSVELAPDLPVSIATDPGRLRQVLKNLVANAFKFTDRGEVRVRVSRAQDGWSATNETLRDAPLVTAFSVCDTGIGITDELQRRIFEAFAQADDTTARQYGGTGLGLSISRELVRLLGGEITLSSTPAQGSTFTVYLPSVAARDVPAPAPLFAAGESRAEAKPPRAAGTALAGMKVLVIDDDVRNIFALTTLLERGKLDVVSAESGKEGLALLDRTPDIDIVLVDIMMPVMDGYATMRAIRQLPLYDDVPILVVTAKVEAAERQRCIDAGASAYVSKPVETDELLLTLGEWLTAPVPAEAIDGNS